MIQMKLKSLIVAAVLTLPSFVAAKETSILYQADVGPLPSPRPLNKEEQRNYDLLFRAGMIKNVPKTVQDAPPVKLAKLSSIERDQLIAEIGVPLNRIPGPSSAGLLKAAPPTYPSALTRNREDASALCYFEVMPDGSVNRIYGENVSHEIFLIACAQTIKLWKFSPSEKPHFCRFLLEAKYGSQ